MSSGSVAVACGILAGYAFPMVRLGLWRVDVAVFNAAIATLCRIPHMALGTPWRGRERSAMHRVGA